MPAWLNAARTTVPRPVPDYVDRPALTGRCLPAARRIVLLRAAGGFGKTTLMAQCCRILTARGVPTAWLTLDELDEPSTLELYLALAFHRAGVAVFENLRLDEPGPGPAHGRLDMLLRAIPAHGGTCVLVLDELERVTDRASIRLIGRLIGTRVPGLHLALACRALPEGLNIEVPLSEGEVEVVGTEDLRFSREEMQRFLPPTLSQDELAAVARDSAGWPIALRVERNARAIAGEAHARVLRDAVYNWIESGLFRQLEENDRERLLDLGLLDWMDAGLIDEILEAGEPALRPERLAALSGLIESTGRSPESPQRLHPLIREYCRERRKRVTPERYRSIHRRAARALARRGETLAAMRHAVEAREDELAARILVDAGGIRLMFREGHDRLVAANRFLTGKAVAKHRRLAFVQSVALVVEGRLREARRALDDEAAASVEAPRDVQREADRCLARSILAQNACESVGSEPVQGLVADYERLADSPELEPPVRAAMEYALCQVHNQKAEFDAALERADRARRRLGPGWRGFTALVDLQVGQVSMAQGRVQAAYGSYRGALGNATRSFLEDSRMIVLGKVLTRELELERNRPGDGETAARIPPRFWQTGAQFASYAAASAIAAELALAHRGAEDALAAVNGMLAHANRAGLASLVRLLNGLRVSLLAEAGLVGEAERHWRASELPQRPAQCLDLERQSWREMETLSCARLRLLIARNAFDAGRETVRGLIGVSGRRGLRRTLMRATALAVVLEESAGDRTAAIGHLAAFLQLFEETDYSRSLVREHRVATPVLAAFLENRPESPQRRSAQLLLAESRACEAVAAPALSGREAQVLERLETQTDREIGAALGITPDGVRYHVTRLFRKLNVHDRKSAAMRARALGLIRSNRQ